MEYNQSNFTYLKKTILEKYYDEIIKAEYICEYFPIITKIIVRKVIEGILKVIAKKYDIEGNLSAWNLFNNINYNIPLPEEINNYIEIILLNGYPHTSHNDNNISKYPMEILQAMNTVLCWYLKEIELTKPMLIIDLNFKATNTIEYKEKKINKIKEEILLKHNQINNLRKRVIELANQSKNVRELNKIIIAIKEEKSYLEISQVSLIKKLEIQKKQVEDTEKNYKVYMKKIEQLEEKYKEVQILIFNTESKLVNAEIQKQELKNLINGLEEQDESISKIEYVLEEELKIVRKAYEHLLNLTNKYQDTLETIEFSYDNELQKILESQANNIKVEINFEDRIFHENITNYTKNISEAKKKIVIFKEILNEKIKMEIKYEPFYRGFLRLENKQLRIIYTMITNVNNTSNLINKSKELLSKSSEDKFLESINRNLEELKNISDNEIKLILYYKLMKSSRISFKDIYNRLYFIRSLDSMVDRSYEILMPKKDFNGKPRKLDAIITYYLEKIIADLRNKDSKLQINEQLIDKIYKNIVTLKQNAENIEKEKIYYDKFDLNDMPESMIRTSIKSQPVTFLSIMVDLAGIDSYKEIFNIIVEVKSLMAKGTSLKGQNEEILSMSFSNEYFMIFLFLSSGAMYLNQKEQEELLPLLIMLISSIDLISSDEFINLESYNNMVDLWKRKQEKYNNISMNNKDKEYELEKLIKEKEVLETNCEELLRTREILSEKYSNYKEEFKKIVMNSEKRVLLPSFIDYDDLRSKKELAEEHINESKSKFGTLKSILSPEVWKDQATKFINQSNMIEAEKTLIEEAKQKPYFKKEYQIFEDLKGKIEEANELINQEKENLKNKNLLIDNLNIKINELQRQLNIMKDTYFDMEDGYR